MKVCYQCGDEKPLEGFNVCKSRADGRQSRCRECDRKAAVEYYQANKAKFASRRIKYRERNRLWIWEYLLEHPCIDCDEKDPRVLEFDHIDPSTKIEAISSMSSNAKLQDIIDEVAKCEVRCANCHRIKTYDQFGWWHGDVAETV